MGVELVVHDDSIDLTFSGRDRFLALSKGIHLPINEITDARVATVEEMKQSLGWRVGGGYWPGRMATGHFTWRGRQRYRQLWSVYKQNEVLVIDTTRKNPAAHRPAAPLPPRPRVAHRRAHPSTSNDRPQRGRAARRVTRATRRGRWLGKPGASCP